VAKSRTDALPRCLRTTWRKLDKHPGIRTRSVAPAFISTLEVDSPMMQAPELRWHWSYLRRGRAHWGFA
jgi:hypothetical protein